jgi:AraC family transcriptional regulator
MALQARRNPRLVPAPDAAGVPAPTLSSASRCWDGVIVEHYRVARVDIVRHLPEHVVTVFLRGPVELFQARHGRTSWRTMHAGDVLVAPAGDPKTLRHKEEAELIRVRIAPSFLARIVTDAGVDRAAEHELLDNFGVRDARIEDIARRLLDEARSDALAGRLCAEALAIDLGIHLLRHYSASARLVNFSTAMLPRHKLQRVTDYINENLREDLTLNRLAATLAMSPFHFAHAFRQATGLAPHRFLLQRRIERAQILLRESELSITEIAHQIGYSNQSSFSALFRRVTGRTPRRFRTEG